MQPSCGLLITFMLHICCLFANFLIPASYLFTPNFLSLPTSSCLLPACYLLDASQLPSYSFLGKFLLPICYILCLPTAWRGPLYLLSDRVLPGHSLFAAFSIGPLYIWSTWVVQFCANCLHAGLIVTWSNSLFTSCSLSAHQVNCCLLVVHVRWWTPVRRCSNLLLSTKLLTMTYWLPISSLAHSLLTAY